MHMTVRVKDIRDWHIIYTWERVIEVQERKYRGHREITVNHELGDGRLNVVRMYLESTWMMTVVVSQ